MWMDYFLGIMLLMIGYLLIIMGNNIHPLQMGMYLILYILIILFKMMLSSNYSILFYIIYLIMVGGLMIMFIYFSSLVSNEKFLGILWMKMGMMTVIYLMIFYLMVVYYEGGILSWSVNLDDLNLYDFSGLGLLFLDKCKGRILLFSLMFLLILMISIVKLCSLKYFSMRKFKYE